MSKDILYYDDTMLRLRKLIDDGIKVDGIFTDPPYKVITGGKNGAKGKPSGILSENKQLMKTIPKFSEWIPLCYEILNDNSHIYIMSNFKNQLEIQTEILKAGFKLHNMIIWKKNTANPNKWYMKNIEYIIFGYKGKAKFINDCGSLSTLEYINPRNKIHLTQKPVGLMKKLVSNSLIKGQTALDPFCGAGATIVACNKLGIDSIGIDNGTHEKAKVIDGIQIQGMKNTDITRLRIYREFKTASKKW